VEEGICPSHALGEVKKEGSKTEGEEQGKGHFIFIESLSLYLLERRDEIDVLSLYASYRGIYRAETPREEHNSMIRYIGKKTIPPYNKRRYDIHRPTGERSKRKNGESPTT